MTLSYHPYGGPKGEPVWKARDEGHTTTYKRVAGAIALPKPEQPLGCVVVVGELYRPDLPPIFEGVGARVGTLPDLELAVGELRQGLHVGTFVAEDEEAVEVVQKVPGLTWASEAVPVAVLSAPKGAAGEIARQRVDTLIRDDRLRLGRLKRLLDRAPEAAAATAIQCLVMWLLENPETYYARSNRRDRGTSGPHGWMGI